jgi:hypothetical protein
MLEPEMINNLREKLSAIFEEGVERERELRVQWNSTL